MNSNDEEYDILLIKKAQNNRTFFVTTHVVSLKVFRLKTEGEREPREFF